MIGNYLMYTCENDIIDTIRNNKMLKKSDAFILITLFVIAGFGFFVCTVFAANDTAFFAPQLNVPIPGLDFTESPVVIEGDYVTIPFLSTYVYAFFKYTVGIALIAASIMFVYGGYLYLLSATGMQVQDAKQKMVDAIVGMVIFLGAYVIVVNVNPNLVQFSGLKVLVVQQDLWGESYPDSSMSDIASGVSYGGQPALGGEDRGQNKGCITSPKYKTAKAICNTVESCGCSSGKIPDFDSSIYPKISDLANLDEISKKTPEEQISSHGLYFPPEGGGAYMIPEAKDALIKAGELAKKQGYFIYVPVTTRPVEYHVKEWCRRMVSVGNPQGLSSPGSSPHNLGLAIDINLGRLEDEKEFLRTLKSGKRGQKKNITINGKFANLITPGGPICNKTGSVNQIDATVAMGINNSKILQKIMADAGWRRFCPEMWHFNYQGVYSVDCTECAFPPTPPHSSMKNCEVKYQP